MAYGIQVRTSKGMQDIVDLMGVRMIHIHQATTVSGSISIPDWDSPEGNYIVVNNSTRTRMPWVQWNNSTKVLSWGKQRNTNDEAWSNNFTVYCME